MKKENKVASLKKLSKSGKTRRSSKYELERSGNNLEDLV